MTIGSTADDNSSARDVTTPFDNIESPEGNSHNSCMLLTHHPQRYMVYETAQVVHLF